MSSIPLAPARPPVQPFEVKRLYAPKSEPPVARPHTAQFTREELLDAIRRWEREYGEPPRIVDWEPSRARRSGHRWVAERFETGHWPSSRMVRRQFGSFNAAIEAAGFTARRRPGRIRPRLAGRDEILVAVREWTVRYGDPPTQTDWDPSRARRMGHGWRAVRYEEGDWPSTRTVVTHFGNLNAAIRAAGLVPRSPGGRTRDPVASAHNRRVAAQTMADRRTAGGPAAIQAAIRDVVLRQREGDPVMLRDALVELAGAALRWSDLVDDEGIATAVPLGPTEASAAAVAAVAGDVPAAARRLSAG